MVLLHPSTAITYDNLALLMYHMGDLRTSAYYLFRTFNIYESISGSEHTNTKKLRKHLLRVVNEYLDQGNSEANLDKCLVVWLDKNRDDEDVSEWIDGK